MAALGVAMAVVAVEVEEYARWWASDGKNHRPLDDKTRYAIVSNIEISDGVENVPPCCILVGVRDAQRDKLLSWNKAGN